MTLTVDIISNDYSARTIDIPTFSAAYQVHKIFLFFICVAYIFLTGKSIARQFKYADAYEEWCFFHTALPLVAIYKQVKFQGNLFKVCTGEEKNAKEEVIKNVTRFSYGTLKLYFFSLASINTLHFK